MTIKNDPSIKDLWFYGLIAMPIAFAGFPLYILAPDYYSTHYGLSLSFLGGLLLILRLLDALQDPFIGTLSDRYRQFYLWYISLSAILLCISIFLLFNKPISVNASLWFVLSMTLAVTSYSILAININSVGALWHHLPYHQTRISTVREACSLMGLLIAVSLPSFLDHFIEKQYKFTVFSLILSIFMLCSWCFFVYWYRSNAHILDKPQKKSWTHPFQTLKHTPTIMIQFFALCAINMISSAIPAILIIFFVRDLLHAESQLGLFLFIYFLSAALSMPIWNGSSNKIGNEKSWFLAMGLGITSFIWAFWLKSGDGFYFIIICIASGMSFGADIAFPPTLLAKQIHKYRLQSYISTYYSGLTFLSKLSLAISSAFVLPLLDMFDFTPGSHQNSDQALLALSITYAIIPCLMKLIALLMLYRFFIQQKKGLL
jgi:GPH family glycoside/pentoside/hexuronide:cation symporter